jgi:TetR/AcrR family transcriptional repressor of nem operon
MVEYIVMKYAPSTRQRMMATALQLFHQNGIHATTVDQVLEKSGTGKSQFYHYFKNKEGLVHAVLVGFYERLKSGNTLQKKVESWSDLKRWFQFFIDFQKSIQFERGCPLGTIGNDLTGEQQLLRQDVRLIFEFIKSSLAEFFLRMKERGDLSSHTDPQSLADFCITIMQGGLLLAKIKRESGPFENSVAHALKYLQSLRN